MDDIKPELVDELLEGYERPEDIVGENGLLKRLTKALLDHNRIAWGKVIRHSRRMRNLLPAGLRVDPQP